MADEHKMWGIKNFPPDIRNAAGAAAKRAGISVADWVAQAVLEKIKADRQGGRALQVRKPQKPTRKPVDLDDVGAVVQMLKDLKGIGAEPPESLKKQAVGLVRLAVSDVKHGRQKVEPAAPVKLKSEMVELDAETVERLQDVDDDSLT